MDRFNKIRGKMNKKTVDGVYILFKMEKLFFIRVWKKGKI